MTVVPFLARLERFASVGSTNDVVRAWLEAGTPEVCLAVADEQTAGRGRDGRTWTAPPGAGLLLSVGFRPTWLEPDRSWRLASIVALAMADAAEAVAGLRERSIRLKWPNDLVVEAWEGGSPTRPPSGSALSEPGPVPALSRAQQTGPVDRSGGPMETPFPGSVAGWATTTAGGGGPEEAAADLLPHAQRQPPAPSRHIATGVLKLAGLLGETIGLGTDDPRVIVGIGINTDWAPDDYPPELAPAMTSLRELAGGRPIDNGALLTAFLERLETRTVALRAGRFDAAGWVARQLTNGRPVRLVALGGGSTVIRALGVDVETGGLIVADPTAAGGQRTVLTGEIAQLRLADGQPVESVPVRV